MDFRSSDMGWDGGGQGVGLDALHQISVMNLRHSSGVDVDWGTRSFSRGNSASTKGSNELGRESSSLMGLRCQTRAGLGAWVIRPGMFGVWGGESMESSPSPPGSSAATRGRWWGGDSFSVSTFSHSRSHSSSSSLSYHERLWYCAPRLDGDTQDCAGGMSIGELDVTTVVTVLGAAGSCSSAERYEDADVVDDDRDDALSEADMFTLRGSSSGNKVCSIQRSQ